MEHEKNPYPPLFLIFLLASSFQNDNDILPSPLLETGEMVGFNNYLELDYVTTYVLKGDGTYTYSSTLREQGSVLDLGVNFFEPGTYRVENNKIKFSRTAFLYRPHSGEKVHYAKDELESAFIEGNMEYSIIYSLKNDGNQLIIPGGMVGGDVIVPDITFEKVD